MTAFTARLTYANVIATLALFLAIGGGAYAATALPKNSVGSAQLKKHAVTPKKIAPQTVNLFKGDRGPAGATHVTARSTSGTIPVTCVPTSPPFYACSGQGTVRAPCAGGERATGGSYSTPNAGFVTDSGPDPATGTPTGWSVSANDNNANSVTFTTGINTTVHVVCAAP